MSEVKLKTPSQFVKDESENLKAYLNNYDIQINKLGFVGFFINLLGHIRYDALQYYQNIFKESFVALAEDENNLYMHSTIYGYETSFATPSTAEGNITFDFSNMPKESKYLKKIVTLKNIVFKYGEIPFTTKTIYKFVEEENNYYAIVYLEDGTIQYIPASTSKITVPFFNVHQYALTKESFKLPNYQYGSYYPYKFQIDNYMSNIQVYVKQPTKEYGQSSEGDLFEVKKIKYLENRHSETCFLKELSTNTFTLEFGSGLRGVYVPGSEVTIYRDLTHGSDGHITASQTLKFELNTTASMSLTSDTNNVIGETRNVNLNLFSVEFDFSDNGLNPPTGDELRSNIFKHIQTREFLIDRDDYYNLTNSHSGDFVYSFRKSHIYRNDFYLHQVIRDEYQNPIKTDCVNISNLNTNDVIVGLISTPVSRTNGELFGTITYTIFATDSFHISERLVINEEVGGPNNAVELIWEPLSNAQSYVIMAYDGDVYRFFTVYDTSFIDFGQESNYLNSFIGSHTDNNTPVLSWKDSYNFFPEVKHNGVTFISPFVYKYNSNFNWFEGNLFYDDFIVLFTNINNGINLSTDYTTPYFHLRVKYDYDNKQTVFEAISSQTIEEYAMKFTVSGTEIQNKLGTRVGENAFTVTYTDDSHGILQDEKTVMVELYYSNPTDNYNDQSLLAHFTTTKFQQIKCIKDQLKLLHYLDENSQEHTIAIPLIHKDQYIQDRDTIDNTVLNSVFQSNVKGRRFPGDEVQFRFLNTCIIDANVLRNSVVQKYDFDLYLPLKLHISILFDNKYVENNNINVVEEKELLIETIAYELQSTYTGNEISIYNSQIVDTIHSDRPFIKSASVTIKDSNGTIIENGIESYDEVMIMENIQNGVFGGVGGKIDILNYFPHFWYWDVDDIQLSHLI